VTLARVSADEALQRLVEGNEECPGCRANARYAAFFLLARFFCGTLAA